MRPIDADALSEKVEALMNRYAAQGRTEVAEEYNFVLTVLMTAETIDPESLRPKGRWEDMYNGLYDNPLYVCSVCKEPAFEKSTQDLLGNWWSRQEQSNFCPNCGARTMEEQHES